MIEGPIVSVTLQRCRFGMHPSESHGGLGSRLRGWKSSKQPGSLRGYVCHVCVHGGQHMHCTFVSMYTYNTHDFVGNALHPSLYPHSPAVRLCRPHAPFLSVSHTLLSPPPSLGTRTRIHRHTGTPLTDSHGLHVRLAFVLRVLCDN